MSDTNNAQHNEVKLEDLLRLKRAERPDDAFWNTFDRELHQRMLQTLVKKDPWYVQLLRGLSGRIAQTTAVGAAAAFLAMLVVRPAFVESTQGPADAVLAQQGSTSLPDASLQLAAIADSSLRDASVGAPVEVAISDFDEAVARDYHMDSLSALSAGSNTSELGYTRDYTHDTFEVAAYDSAAYITDTASFAGTSIATSLVY